MALMDLLVHVDRTPDALRRLRMGADLARRHGSRLTALYVREPDASQLYAQRTAEYGLVPADDLNRSRHQDALAGDEAAEELTKELAAIKLESGLDTELRSVEGPAARVLAQHARFADLCMVHGSAGVSAGYSFSEAVLFGSGRPLLMVPDAGTTTTLGRHILVAWNSSRASARALNDALPLIERAERTTVLAVNPAEYVERYDALAPERIVEHVRRHGRSVEGIRLEKVESVSIAQVIQDQAQRLGADMVVAGAFGHPKVWEKLMGGVTRDLLARMRLPILMSY